MADWDKIRKEYETTNKTMKSIAEDNGVSPSTLSGRKGREGWKKDEQAVKEHRKKTQQKRRVDEVVKDLSNNPELNDRQKKFCLLYLQYFNATKAYMEAYGVDNYQGAGASGSQLLSNPKIKAELDRLKRNQFQDLYIDSLDIKREWMKQAFADITDFVEFGQEEYHTLDAEGNVITKMGSYVRLKEDTSVDGTLIQEVRQGRDGVTVKLHDKQKAMDKLQDSLETSGSNRREIIVIKDDWAEEEDDGTED